MWRDVIWCDVMFRFLKGGQLVGAAMKGRRVLVIDDVITAGKAQALSRAARPWHNETHTASCKQFLFIFIVGVRPCSCSLPFSFQKHYSIFNIPLLFTTVYLFYRTPHPSSSFSISFLLLYRHCYKRVGRYLERCRSHPSGRGRVPR